MRMRTTLALAMSTILLTATASTAATDCTFTMVPDTQTMLLDGDCTTSLEQFSPPDGWTLDCQGQSITAVGGFRGAVIHVVGQAASVRNCIITASDLPCACSPSADRLRGILFDQSSGIIADNFVLDMNQGLCGCQEGNGIEVRSEPFDGTGTNPYYVEITNNNVLRYQKNGITANGNVEVVVADNMVSGQDKVPFIAQNGIQIGFGATGEVKRNTVDGNWFTGASWTSTGLLVFEASGNKIVNNTVQNNQVGIDAEAWFWFVYNADSNRIINNRVTNSGWGIVVQALDLCCGYSTGDASTSFNRILGNDIENTATVGSVGIYLGAGEAWGGSGKDPYALRNRIQANEICGFASPITLDGDTDTRVKGNRECGTSYPGIAAAGGRPAGPSPFEPGE